MKSNKTKKNSKDSSKKSSLPRKISDASNKSMDTISSRKSSLTMSKDGSMSKNMSTPSQSKRGSLKSLGQIDKSKNIFYSWEVIPKRITSPKKTNSCKNLDLGIW